VSSRLAPLRPFWLLLPLGLLLLAAFLRMAALQAAEDSTHAIHAARALAGVQAEHRRPAPRGAILDREGRVLAADVAAWRLVLDCPYPYRRHREERCSREQVVAEIRPLADAARLEVERVVDALRDPEATRKVLAGGLSPGTARRLQAILAGIPGTGLRLEPELRRVHPQGRSLAHLVGLLQRQPRRGSFGLEALLDRVLASGRDGLRCNLRVSRDRGVDPLLDIRPMRPGPAVVTTLDAAVGVAARAELAALAARWHPAWCAAVVVDVPSGELLATAVLPDFDPETGAPSGWLELPGGGKEPVGYLDRVFQPVVPGSTVKPLLMAEALARGLVRDQDRFPQGAGSIRVLGRVVHNVRYVPRRPLDWREVLIHSANVGAVQVGLRLGPEGVREALHRVGLDEATGLVPFERPGRLPPPERWEGFYGRRDTLVSASFGRGFTTTPVALAYAFAALAADGLRPVPRILSGDAPSPPRRVWPAEVARRVRVEALREVVATRSHRLPHWPDLDWGGKSGTVEKQHEPGYISLFVAMGPIAAPRAVVVVVAEDVQAPEPYGSKVCAPVAGRLLRRTLELRGLLPPEDLDRAPAAAIVALGH